VLSGHGLGGQVELNQALLYENVSPSLPAVLTLVCVAGSGQSHAEVIQQGDPARLIVAGTLNDRRFSGVSTTWLKHVHPGSGKYGLGMFMNDLQLTVYGVGGKVIRADQHVRAVQTNAWLSS